MMSGKCNFNYSFFLLEFVLELLFFFDDDEDDEDELLEDL